MGGLVTEDSGKRGIGGLPVVAATPAILVVLALLTALIALVATPVPAAAGELRTILEAEAGVRSDGNYEQRFQAEGVNDEGQELARAGFHLRLSYLLPRLELALNYSPSYEWVLDSADINGTTHRLDLGLVANLTRRLEMRVRERLISSPTLDLYGPFSEPEPVVLTRRGDQLSNSLDVALNQGLTRRASLLLGASHTLRTFESEDLSDTETLGARIGANWEFLEGRNFDIVATAGYYDFGERRFPDDGTGAPLFNRRASEADVQTLGLAWAQPFLRDGRFRVEGGVFTVDSVREIPAEGLPGELPTFVEVEENHTGWRGGFELSRQLRVFGWNLGYRHDVSAGNGLGRATEVDAAFAGVSSNVGRNLVLGLDGNFSRHQDLDDENTDPLLPDDPDSLDADRNRLAEFAAGTARFSWNFSTVARLTGGYSKVWQESRVEPFEDLSYSRYFLGIALQLYRSGEEPQDPAHAGETEDDDEPDAQ